MSIETKRLVLRPWKESDAKDLYTYASSPQVGPIAGWPCHTSVTNSLEIIKTLLLVPETFAICLKDDRAAIGSISLKIGKNSQLCNSDQEGEIGYWIGVPFWGKGLMTEAVKEMICHGFLDLKLKKIWCGYFDGNIRSKRVQEKCGFIYQNKTSYNTYDGDRQLNLTCLTKQIWEGNKD